MGVIKVPLPPQDTNVFQAAWGYVTTILKGLSVTKMILVKQLFKLEKTETIEWPEEPADYGPRFKGKHFLTRRDDGNVRCTACFLCATACPAECIYIEAGEHKSKTIEKYPVRFEIDILRCVFCGFCEEACPVDAIRLGPEYIMLPADGTKWVYTKEYLAARTNLNEGIQSIKEEEEKHPQVTSDTHESKHHRSLVKHGKH